MSWPIFAAFVFFVVVTIGSTFLPIRSDARLIAAWLSLLTALFVVGFAVTRLVMETRALFVLVVIGWSVAVGFSALRVSQLLKVRALKDRSK